MTCVSGYIEFYLLRGHVTILWLHKQNSDFYCSVLAFHSVLW